jgi:hypothetical protein
MLAKINNLLLMKFDFWFDLPKALVNIAGESTSKEELELSMTLNKSLEVNYLIKSLTDF